MKPFSSLIVLLVCVTLMLSGSAVIGQDRADSIQKFVSRMDRWNDLVNVPMTVEGRVGVMTDNMVHFEKCDLPFRFKLSGMKLPRDSRVLEVTGSLVREKGMLFFDVTEARKLDSDLDRVTAMRTRVETGNPQGWYSLADWALSRGEFYQDQSLREKAVELREIGLSTEGRRLKFDDTQGQLELARKARDWGVESFAWKTVHDVTRFELGRANRDPGKDLSALITRVMRDLPGAETPLEKADWPLLETVRKDPLMAYAAADQTQRRKMNRVLLVDVLLVRIERDAASDGSNGDQIANRIEQQIPEEAARATTWREKYFASMKSRLATLSRNDVRNLSLQLELRNKPEEAEQVKRDWLRAREQSARGQGYRGYLQLAEDTLELLKDKEAARTLYQAAWRENPKAPEPIAWLTDQGMVLRDDRWMRATDVPTSPDDRFQRAIQEGRVMEGMTRDQARAALSSQPASVVREVSLGQVTELWIFRNEGLVVSLVRKRGETTATVERVTSLLEQ